MSCATKVFAQRKAASEVRYGERLREKSAVSGGRAKIAKAAKKKPWAKGTQAKKIVRQYLMSSIVQFTTSSHA
jgi:hypothetical protein